MKVLGLIPARGGSKGLPGKNLAPIAGRPLLAWTVLAAQAARGIDRVIVSTDSPAIAEVARANGVEAPFLRPAELAQDDTPGIAPPLHALRWLAAEEGYRPDYLLLLQPTSPLRRPHDIEGALELARDKSADGVVSVTPAECHPHWMVQLDPEGRMHDFLPLEHRVTRRQDLPSVYSLNGAIFLARSTVLLERETWYTDKTYAYVMPRERSIDIDDAADLRLAEILLQQPATTEEQS